ncbi:hypothetical protein ACFL2B_02565 [Patescibacteria group bacterium]
MKEQAANLTELSRYFSNFFGLSNKEAANETIRLLLHIKQKLLPLFPEEEMPALPNTQGFKVKVTGIIAGLSPFDIAITALNAYCSGTAAGFPPPPTYIGEDEDIGKFFLLTLKEHFYTFFHLIWDSYEAMIDASARNQRWKYFHLRDRIALLCKETQATLPWEVYANYGEALQQTTQMMYEKPEIFREECADLVAALTFIPQSKDHNFPSIIQNWPMLRCGKNMVDDLCFHFAEGTDCAFTIKKWGDILIPGAGILAVKNFPEMITAAKSRGIRFLLNDNNEFVTRVFEKLRDLHQADDWIKIIPGDCGEIDLPEKTVSGVIISLLHKANQDSLQKLSCQAEKFCEASGTIALFTPEESKGNLSPKEMMKIFNESFRVVQMRRIFYQLLTPDPIEKVSQKSFAEIWPQLKELFSEENTATSEAVFIELHKL